MQWLLIDKSTPISDQGSPAVHKSMLCNAICLHSNFLQIEHLDRVGQAQGTSKISYHNYLPRLHTIAFQLDFIRPKHSTNYTQVNSRIALQVIIIISGHGDRGYSRIGGHGGDGYDNKSNPNPS